MERRGEKARVSNSSKKIQPEPQPRVSPMQQMDDWQTKRKYGLFALVGAMEMGNQSPGGAPDPGLGGSFAVSPAVNAGKMISAKNIDLGRATQPEVVRSEAEKPKQKDEKPKPPVPTKWKKKNGKWGNWDDKGNRWTWDPRKNEWDVEPNPRNRNPRYQGESPKGGTHWNINEEGEITH